MDLNYDIKKWDFSLRAMTLTTITKNILEDARRHPTSTMDAEVIAKRATEKAEKLDLLPGLITEIKMMIKPMMKGILRWYELYGFGIYPILTPVGTVDVEKSAKALIECKNQPIGTLFDVACDHCLEEDIFWFGRQLSQKVRANYGREQRWRHSEDVTSTLKFFWLEQMYGRNFTQFDCIGMITLDSLSPRDCIDGIYSAVLMKNSFAVEYFWKKASSCAYISLRSCLGVIEDVTYWMQPALLAKLFQFDQANYMKCMVPNLILRALLQWPYQHLFLKEAERLLPTFNLEEYLEVLWAIISVAKCDYEDHNYKRLFIGFWRMGKDHKSSLNSDQTEIYRILSEAFRMNDKIIAFTVFDDMLESNREEYFLHFVWKDLEPLIFSGNYKVILLFLHVCKVRDQRLYFQFKRFFVGNPTHRSPLVYQMESGRIISFPHLTSVNLREFVELMSEWENSGFPDGQSTVPCMHVNMNSVCLRKIEQINNWFKRKMLKSCKIC